MGSRLLLGLIVGSACLLVMCREQQPPARSGGDEPAHESSLNEKHEAFKRGFRETTETLEQNVNKVHEQTKQAVRKTGKDLHVRSEVLGTSSAQADAGAPKR
jgi:hypothetical protein